MDSTLIAIRSVSVSKHAPWSHDSNQNQFTGTASLVFLLKPVQRDVMPVNLAWVEGSRTPVDGVECVSMNTSMPASVKETNGVVQRCMIERPVGQRVVDAIIARNVGMFSSNHASTSV